MNTLFDKKSDALIDGLRKVLAPIDKARGLPNLCYTNPVIFSKELKDIFLGGWACAGFSKDASSSGDLYPFEFAGIPLIMIRDENDIIHIYHNVCQHRGRILVDAPISNVKGIVCPYHGWTYNLKGKLVGTPGIGGAGKHSCDGFLKQDVQLNEVQSAEWLGLIFVNISEAKSEFSRYIAPIAKRWQFFENAVLTHTGTDSTIKFNLECNWKLVIENYCEAYHLPLIHPDLNSYSPLSDHYPIVETTYSGQGSNHYDPAFCPQGQTLPSARGLPVFWAKGAEYIALYPNVLLGIHRDHFFAALINPKGVDNTEQRVEIFYNDESAVNSVFNVFRQENKKLWKKILLEDKVVIESMQRGRLSPGFNGGVFSPAMDIATHKFHIWVANVLLEGR